MGEVFEAWDTLLNRQVAVKTLSVPHPNAIIRFMKEAQLQARVSHPNVCRIYDVDVSENVPFIAMQLVKGHSLFEVAPELTVEEAVEILASVALGMHAAHRVNLIHRDLKPSNILLERSEAGSWIPYVADFGLAKDLEEEGLTQTHGVMGTPSFMAPEQRNGEGALVGPQTDIYSLGATLCSVLNLDRYGKVTAHDPSNSSRGDTGSRAPFGSIPRKLKIILHRCLEERIEDRYPTAGALAEDFRRFLDGEPLLAEHRGWQRRARRQLRNHPALAASLGITLLLGAAFSLWSVNLAALGKRRTALALRFAGEARDLENSIGVERLHPPHDMRPVLDRMAKGLDRIQNDIGSLGPEAKGPGKLALGRGYLAMRFLEPALQSLEEAWNSGYRSPDLAYALCRTHSELYIRVLDQEQTGDIPVSPERSAHHLRAARDYYAQCAGATWEPRELCLARIQIFQHRGAEALDTARNLYKSNQWFYEAKVEESYAFESLGYTSQQHGDFRSALAYYRQAEATAKEAQVIGRSDQTCYMAAMDWRLRWLENPGIPPREALAIWKEAEALADTILTIRPGSPRAFSTKVHIILGQARARKKLGQNPGPDLARAEEHLRTTQLFHTFQWLIPVKADLIRATRKELGA